VVDLDAIRRRHLKDVDIAEDKVLYGQFQVRPGNILADMGDLVREVEILRERYDRLAPRISVAETSFTVHWQSGYDAGKYQSISRVIEVIHERITVLSKTDKASEFVPPQQTAESQAVLFALRGLVEEFNKYLHNTPKK
jgi:hypothetical protein